MFSIITIVIIQICFCLPNRSCQVEPIANMSFPVESLVQLLIEDILLSVESQMNNSPAFDDLSYICLSSDQSSSTIWIHSSDSSSLPSLSLVPGKRRRRSCSESDDERLPSLRPACKHSRLVLDSLSSSSSSSDESSYLPSFSLEPRFKRALISPSDYDEQEEETSRLPSLHVPAHRQHDLDSTMEDASDFEFDD